MLTIAKNPTTSEKIDLCDRFLTTASSSTLAFADKRLIIFFNIVVFWKNREK